MTATTDEIVMTHEQAIERLKTEIKQLKCCGNCIHFESYSLLHDSEYCDMHESPEHPRSLFLFSYSPACEYWEQCYLKAIVNGVKK